ncbi:hypothetical protein SESBI_09542 [Sesbania bispinosa]|nr:hypothetical protein SESBI_09542 [Sesbania bispinosa]
MLHISTKYHCNKSKQLENQKKHEEQVSRDFSEEIIILTAENEKLKVEIFALM